MLKEETQGTVTATPVDERKHSCLPAAAKSSSSSSSIQLAGLGTINSKVMITPCLQQQAAASGVTAPPEARGCALLIYYRSSVFSETAIKALVTAESQFKMWQWTQVEKEEFRTTLFFSYFEDKLVESRDSWKTEKEISLNNGALITPKVEILVCFRISLHCWVRSVRKYLPLNILK